MLEIEAKTKWCPLSRVGEEFGEQIVTFNRDTTDNTPGEGTLCLGSGCMMWRVATEGITAESKDGKMHQHGDCGLKR